MAELLAAFADFAVLSKNADMVRIEQCLIFIGTGGS
jgi:hypothetical protein